MVTILFFTIALPNTTQLKCERHLEVILYYAAEEYIYYLENQTAFSLKQEIKINGLYEQNQNERFLIYEL